MNPLISVIVPVYRVEKYLSRCVDSILAQTYRNLEILLVDDGSPDRCPQICDEYAKKDPRVRVVHQKNLGVSAARNAGLDRARGDYIGFVDSDDSIDPEMFEKLFYLNEKYHTPISMCRYCEVYADEPGKDLLPKKNRSEEGVLSAEDAMRKILLPGRYNGSLWNKLFQRGLFNGEAPVRLDATISSGEDLLAVAQCMLRVREVAYTTQPYYFYQFNLDSAIHGFSKKSLTALTSREKIIPVIPPALAVVAKASYANAASSLLYRAYASKSWEFIPLLKKERGKYLYEFNCRRRDFPGKDRIRVLGSGLCSPFFCRAWNAMKAVRLSVLEKI